MLVAIPLFERFTALDAVGPYEVLQRVPSIGVVFVGHQRGEVRSDNGMPGMMVDKTFGELTQPDVVDRRRAVRGAAGGAALRSAGSSPRRVSCPLRELAVPQVERAAPRQGS